MAFRPARSFQSDPSQRSTEPHRPTKAEAEFADEFTAAVAATRRGVTLGDLEAAGLDERRVVALYDWDALAERLTEAVEGTLGPMFVEAARSVLDDLGIEVEKAVGDSSPGFEANVDITVRFDLTNPAAVDFARGRAGELVTQIGTSARQGIRQIVTRALAEGLTRREVARLVRAAGVGLHSRYSNAVVAMHDREVSRLAREHPSWSPGRVADEAGRRSSRYADRLLRSRSRTIARTELLTASNQGKLAGWQEAANRNVLDPTLMEREWRTGPTSLSGISPCPVCTPLHGTRAPFGQPFSNGAMMPPAHVNCRCTAVVVTPEHPAAPPVEGR